MGKSCIFYKIDGKKGQVAEADVGTNIDKMKNQKTHWTLKSGIKLQFLSFFPHLSA